MGAFTSLAAFERRMPTEARIYRRGTSPSGVPQGAERPIAAVPAVKIWYQAPHRPTCPEALFEWSDVIPAVRVGFELLDGIDIV